MAADPAIVAATLRSPMDLASVADDPQDRRRAFILGLAIREQQRAEAEAERRYWEAVRADATRRRSAWADTAEPVGSFGQALLQAKAQGRRRAAK